MFRTPVHQAERHTAPGPTADVSPIAAELDSTVSILRLGAFLLALRRRGRHAPRVAVEQPNRAAGPFAGVLGPVATTALLPVPAAATVRGFLAAVRDLVLDAHEHQDLPGDVPSGLVPRVRFTERRGPVPGPGFGADAGTLLPAETRLPCGDLAFCHVDEVGLVIDHDPAAEHAAAAAEVASVYRFLLDRLDRCLDLAPDELPASPEEARRAEQAWAREASAVDAMREIFADVLDLAEVGPRDNFFELGGTSLSVARVVSRVGRRFGTAPSFADVLDHPCPAALAEVVRRAAAPPRPVLEPRPPLAELPASPQQVRYFLTYDIDPASSGRITVLTDEWDDAEAFLSALTDVVARHELLRTGFFTGRSGDLWQRVLPAATPEVTEVRLGAGGPAERRAELDALMRSHVFDLAAPPLLRVMFERRTDGGALAAVGVFSGILDAYSQGVLARELRTAYDRARDAARGRAYDAARDVARRGAPPAPPMPAPSLQYQDFCRWQHDLASGEEFARARDFWEERYPTDHRGFHLPAAGGERAGAMRVFLLGEELSDRARDAAARCESSLFGFLLANFFERAAELYGRDDVSVGVLYHGRENEELAELIGYFVDLFCLRCDVRRPGHFPDLVRRVNQEFFRAVDARAYQYQHLAERLGASPSDPVFPVTGFHVNNVIIPGRREPVADDFRERVLDLPYRPKFDFNVYVHETDRGVLVRMAYATAVVDHAGAAAFAAAFTAGVRRNAAAALEHAV
ncbi:condensation domain-containing protein [Spirillospora sp. NPDC047279]|uniref:condensation domain-containing protein n=1 Tax=Spirillospora sp. NPDC047279 TaxID=3155478 RepID=UPI003410F200